jgi:hypothetical protein
VEFTGANQTATSADVFSKLFHPLGGFNENPYSVFAYDLFETCSAHPATRTKTTNNIPRIITCLLITYNKRKPPSAIKEICLQKTEQKDCLLETLTV